MSSPTDGSCGDSERQESAVPESPFTGRSATGRRRRLQRRSVSANAVSDVFYRAYNGHHREAASPPRVHDGITIEHAYFVDEEDDEEELYHHNGNYNYGHDGSPLEATSGHFGRAEHPLVSQHELLQGSGESRVISGPSGAGGSQDANSNSSGNSLR